jgi:hypothetical protein
MHPDAPSAPCRTSEPPEPDEPPPILGSWQRMYELVLVTLLVVVLVLAFLTRVYT